jgi:transposase-like protein
MKTVINNKVVHCTLCGSEDVIKGGNGRRTMLIAGVKRRCYIKRFWCKSCGKNFTPKGEDTVIVSMFAEIGGNAT